jgi:hypothetical protein
MEVLIPGARIDLCHELLDLRQLETGGLGDADEAQPPKHRLVVAALAALAFWLGEQADRLVVADRGRRHACPGRDLPDGELRPVRHGLGGP